MTTATPPRTDKTRRPPDRRPPRPHPGGDTRPGGTVYTSRRVPRALTGLRTALQVLALMAVVIIAGGLLFGQFLVSVTVPSGCSGC